MLTKLHARQVIARDLLQRLAPNLNSSQLDSLLRSINSELTPLLELKATSTPSLTVNIGSSILNNIETSYNKAMAPIKLGLPNISSGSIVFPSSDGGTITVTPGTNITLNCPSGNFTPILVSFTKTNQILLVQGAPQSSLTLAINNTPKTKSGTMPIGTIIVRNVGGTIQNITPQDIYQFGSGAGGGGGDIEIDVVLGENLSANVPVYISKGAADGGRTAGRAYLLDNTNDNRMEFIGFLTEAGSTGETKSVKIIGLLEGFSGLTPGLPVYWDGGVLTQTIPTTPNTWQITVGKAISATEILINPDLASSAVYLGDNKGTEEIIALRNTLDESYFKYLTPSIFADIENTTLVDTGNTTATYNLITKTYNFTAGQVVRSLDLVDSSFYDQSKDIDEAMFVVFWDKNNVDTNATYELSRDNGVTWQTVTMTRNGLTGEYSGVKKFSAETLSTTGSTAHTSDQVINITTSKKVSQKFTLSEARVVKEFTVSLKKTGTPGGNIVAKLVKDSGGNPSLSVTDLIAYDEKSISSMSGGIATYTFNFGLQALKAGDYHIVFETNINYDNTFVSGSHEVAVGLDTAGSNPDAKIYDGTSWTGVSGQTIKLQYSYKSLKLLARITASATAKLKGFGVLYSSDPDFVSPVSYMNIIIGSTAQVDSGLATHTSLSSALNDASAGSSITMLKTTVAGGVTWNQDGVVVRGEGFLSVINGNLTISGNDNILQNVKINGNLVVNGDYNVIRDCWVTGTVTDNGNANSLNLTLGA